MSNEPDDVQTWAEGWIAGQWTGETEGRTSAVSELVPYVHHIGNCGAIDSNEPDDSRCICGLRRLWSLLS